MLAVTALICPTAGARPPVVLVHGAASSAPVWTYWQAALGGRGWSTYALDLRGHGASAPFDLSRTSMADYAADVAALAAELARPPILMGWSMGGLVALLAAATGPASACVALAPSAPAAAIDPTVELRSGEFGPEEYGITSRDPDRQRGMRDLDRPARELALRSLSRESRLARDERKRGIVIERLACPLLLVTSLGDRDWPAERYADLRLPADRLSLVGASHWGLVLNRPAVEAAAEEVGGWLERMTLPRPDDALD